MAVGESVGLDEELGEDEGTSPPLTPFPASSIKVG